MQVCIYWEYRWITINLHCFESTYLCHQNMTFVNRRVIFLYPCSAQTVLPSYEPMKRLNAHHENKRMMIDVLFPFCRHRATSLAVSQRTYTHSVIVTRRTLMGALYRHLYTNYIHTQLLCTTMYCTICDILHDHMQLVGQSHNALADPTCRRIVIFLL